MRRIVMNNDKKNSRPTNEGYQPKKIEKGYQPSKSDTNTGYQPEKGQEQPPSPPTKE
jgi:hypothetical protein